MWRISGTDACALPVLSPKEARASEMTGSPFPMAHPQVAGSQSSVLQFGDPHAFYLSPGQHTREILEELQLDREGQKQLALDGALGEEAQASVYSDYKL